MRISDWSSDVCSSDLHNAPPVGLDLWHGLEDTIGLLTGALDALDSEAARGIRTTLATMRETAERAWDNEPRSEEHTSELQSLMRNSYAVFCLNKKKHQ